MRGLVPVGRVLFALIFLFAALGHFSGDVIAAASARGVPLASVLVPFAGVIAGVGATLVAIGYRARFGAFLLLVFLVPVTFVMHDFGSAELTKNTSLIGATLMLMYWGSGPYSLDG